jgi:hypothetical protein
MAAVFSRERNTGTPSAGNWAADLDVQQLRLVPVTKVTGYKVPTEVTSAITKELNSALPGSAFVYSSPTPDKHEWRSQNPYAHVTVYIRGFWPKLTGEIIVHASLDTDKFASFLRAVRKAFGEAEPPPSREAPPPPPASFSKQEECRRRLEEAGIRTRSDFRKWSVQNHPDKGGDMLRFQEINACMDTVFPRGGTRKSRRKRRKTRRRL